MENEQDQREKDVGSVSSATEQHPEGGNRRFAIAMMRGDAEALHKPMTYRTESGKGSAWLLDGPPIF